MIQLKLFTISIYDYEEGLKEINKFLKNNKILELKENLVSNGDVANWCFIIKYMEKGLSENAVYSKKSKIDYKKILDENTFKKFSKFREIRKKIAVDEGIPAYAIFTDEELASLAKLEKINKSTMLKIKGIGDKKVERYSEFFISDEVKNEKIQ